MKNQKTSKASDSSSKVDSPLETLGGPESLRVRKALWAFREQVTWNSGFHIVSLADQIIFRYNISVL